MTIRNRFFIATAFVASLAMQAPVLAQEEAAPKVYVSGSIEASDHINNQEIAFDNEVDTRNEQAQQLEKSLAQTCRLTTCEATPQGELDCVSVPNFKNIQEVLKKGFKKTGTKIKAAAVKYPLLLTYSSLVSLGISTKYILEAYEMSTQTGTVFIDCLFTILCGANYFALNALLGGYAMIPMLIFEA